MIYLDYAATAPVNPAAAEAVYTVLTKQFANPSAQYAPGREMAKQVENWRGVIASALGCPADRLIFTSGGTESDNWAVQAACWQNRHTGKHIVTSAVEHKAILEPCRWMEQQGYHVTRVQPDSYGNISVESVLSAVTEETALVSVMLVNNELGNRYPVEEIARELRKRYPKTLLHTDAVQGFLKVPFSAGECGADFVSVSAHKIGGPKGIGALYIGPRVTNLKPFLAGGGQENGRRSGTEATAQIAGFAKAVEIWHTEENEIRSRLAHLREYAIERVREIPDCVIIGGGTAAQIDGNHTVSGGTAAQIPGNNTVSDRNAAQVRGAGTVSGGTAAPVPGNTAAPHILALALEGWPGQNIVTDLSAQGIYISAGAACHRGKISHVTAALHLPKRVAQSMIRVSFGPQTTESDIDAFVTALRRHHDTRMPML